MDTGTHYVPAIAQQELTHITHEQLCSIKKDDSLSLQGTITALVIRPQEHYRTLVDSIEITKEGIKGDKHAIAQPHNVLDVISLMRSDVSEALGGAHVAGDNIHVQGMSLSKKNIKTGDIIVIQNKDAIKAILLKTHMPHYACWKLAARCGKTAFNFINAEGEYKDGMQSIHGANDRLRGVILAVLQAHESVTIGDFVNIATPEQKEKILADKQLKQSYDNLLAMSKEIGKKMQKQEKAKRALRNKKK
jgi:hypothetical protein